MKACQNKISTELHNTVCTEHRKITGALPTATYQDALECLQTFESRSMQGQFPLLWERAIDSAIFDASGNQWIDFTSTIFVANTGHANSSVIEAVKAQLDSQLLHSYAYLHKGRAEYCKKLVEFAGKNFEKVFLLSAGTEATEAALKLMRLNALKQNKRKPGVVCIEGNWHGRTMGAQLMSSNVAQKAWIGFSDPNMHHIAFPYPWLCSEEEGKNFFYHEINKLLAEKQLDPSKDLCGFMLETFQGWAACFYPTTFVKAIRQFCDEHGLLLTFDEMQAGFARTGKKFGYEHYGVKADLLCVGKGIASGFPLSGVIGESAIMDLPTQGDMSSTHSANPICCTAGNATIDYIIDHDLVEQSHKKGKLLHEALISLQQEYPDIILSIEGKGLIAAIIFNLANPNIDAKKIATSIAKKCFANGLLVVHTGRESIKIGPPLTIPYEVLQEGIQVLLDSTRSIIRETI